MVSICNARVTFGSDVTTNGAVRGRPDYTILGIVRRQFGVRFQGGTRIVLGSHGKHTVIEDTQQRDLLIDARDGGRGEHASSHLVENRTSIAATIRDRDGTFPDIIHPGEGATLEIREGVIVTYRSQGTSMTPARIYSRVDVKIAEEKIVIVDRDIRIWSDQQPRIVTLFNHSFGKVIVSGTITLEPKRSVKVSIEGSNIHVVSPSGFLARSGETKPHPLIQASDTLSIGGNEDLVVTNSAITKIKLPKVTTMIEKCHLTNNNSACITVIGYELGETLDYTLSPGRSVSAYIAPVFGFAYTSFKAS